MSYRTGRLLRCTEMSLVLALCLAAAPAPGQGASWSRVVAALQLVAEEYSEALELHDRDAARRRQLELAELLERVAPLVPAPDIRAGVESIRTRSLGVDYKLGGDCRALVQQVLEHAPIRRTPHAKPDLAKGKKLYAEACAACHGADATGDSSLTATMDPPPGNILHPVYNWSPYEMFNRVTYGGAQTAMPSFENAVSEMERWDIVFYLFAERWPPCEKPLSPLRADELALLGDFELGNRFGYGAASCLRREFLPPAPPDDRKR